MDKVFQEEQIKLAETESKIDSIVSRYDNISKELQSEINDFYCVDYDDIQKKQELRQKRLRILELEKQFRGYISSPYFGRLDLDKDDSEESETFYIGKESISDGPNMMVIDWRSPVGHCYYASNQKTFCVNGNNYYLALKRALDVKNGTLISYKTDYDGESVSLDGDIVDPFLLTVLKDKRRHNRLTDIIRTIQENQNDIIRKHRHESFIVQGCAGSGKTMVLLHRLSFLKFNNRSMSLSGVKIITPNKFFDEHINSLSEELGLNTIERFSVEEYYVSLIKKYASKTNIKADVYSEKTLDPELLADIYSLKYFSDSISHYHEYWNKMLRLLDEEQLRDYFNRYSINYPDTTLHTAETLFQLESALQKIESFIFENEKKRKKAEVRVETLSKEIKSSQVEFDRRKSTLNSIKGQTISRIKLEVVSSESIIKDLEDKIVDEKKAITNKQIQKKQIEEDLQQIKEINNKFLENINKYSDYDSFERYDDTASRIIRKKYDSLIREISDANKNYQKIPIYNFGKRNSLRKQITEKKNIFARKITDFSNEFISNAEEKINDLYANILKCNQIIYDEEIRIQENESEIANQKNKLDAFNECFSILHSNETPNTQNILGFETHQICASILNSYEEQLGVLSRISRRIESYKNSRKDLEEEYRELVGTKQYDEKDRLYVSDSLRILKRLQLSELSRNVMYADLLTCYKAHKQQYEQVNYRHKIYLKLLYCYLYFDRQINLDTFINIDEAQDISIAEYRLLRMILGEKCVFNLYGDINQSIYSYKGIKNWKELADIITENVYTLNENYRNTLQITEFCNREFEAKVYPIGIPGEAVIERSTAESIKWILNLKANNPDFRVAIIHRHGLKAVHECLKTLLKKEDVSWYSVDDKKLSVLSVETAKGLEFEAVVAIVDQMSNNEKYVSYTRALDHLVVVRDSFSSELETDEIVEESNAEFIFENETNYDDLKQARQGIAYALGNIVDSLADKQGFRSQNETADYATGNLAEFIVENKTNYSELQQVRQEIVYDLGNVIKTLGEKKNSYFQNKAANHPTGNFFSWEILDEKTAIKTCDKSFFEHNESGVPREISWFFDSANIQRGESKQINFIYNDENYIGKVFCEQSEHSRKRISWGTALGEFLCQFRSKYGAKAVFEKVNYDTYRLTMMFKDEKELQIEPKDFLEVSNNAKVFSQEDSVLIEEFNSILSECFGLENNFSEKQQSIILSLYHGESVACEAPSGSMKSIILYLLARKEHQDSGKQTLLTAEAHLQENELALVDKLGLKGGVVDTMNSFIADFKREKYDVIFVPYEFFKNHENIEPFVDYFKDKVAYWGLDHPALEKDLWTQLNNCGATLETVMFLMDKSGFDDLELSEYKYVNIANETGKEKIEKHTMLTEEDKMKWLLDNTNVLSGQGLIYCDDEATCKVLGKNLRKVKIKAEAYIDVANSCKKEHINYLTNSFSNGGLPVLITTQEAGKNLSNPNIRFVIHYDVPANPDLYKLHVMQIGKLANEPIVHDFFTCEDS